jgi:hypothetical protein
MLDWMVWQCASSEIDLAVTGRRHLMARLVLNLVIRKFSWQCADRARRRFDRGSPMTLRSSTVKSRSLLSRRVRGKRVREAIDDWQRWRHSSRRLFPRSQVDIFVEVLQADGGVLPAAINAASLALVDAGVPMVDFVCACASGVVEGEPILGTAARALRMFVLPRTRK